MNDRSREEIESQFRSTPRKDAMQRKKNSPDLIDQRSVKVIGGKIQGLGGTKKSKTPLSIFVAVGLICLSLLSLFVFLGERKKTEINSESSIATSDKNKSNKPSADIAFTRDDDIQRAQNYREEEKQEKEAQKLLSLGITAFQNGSYTQPNGTSALDYFRQVLIINKTNYRAKEGIEAINNRFLEIGEAHLSENNLNSAYTALESLKSIEKDSYQTVALAEQIFLYEQEKPIRDGIEKALLAEKDNRWVSPKNNSAIDYYQEVITLDKDNTDASQGLKRVLNKSILLANRSVIKGDFEEASSFVEAIIRIDPTHPSIALFKEQLTNRFTDVIESELNSLPLANTQPLNTNTVVNQSRSNAVFDQKTPNEELDESSLRLGLSAFNNQEYLRSIALLTPIADKGIARARARLSFIYHLGLGVPNDRGLAELYAQQSIEALQKFAAEGRAWAQTDLGSMYAYGLAVSRNLNLAFDWRNRAASQQYPEAQRHLGDMFLGGLGVTTNIETAISLYQSAKRNGDTQASAKLRSLGIN